MKRKFKPTLYLIGGFARAGKTMVAREVMRRKRIISVSTDTIRAAIRKVLIGESRVAVEKASFRGKVAFHRPGSLKVYHFNIIKDYWDEDKMTWQGILGFIETHDRHKTDLLIEGIAITPERVHRLKLKNFRVKAVFVGYSRESYLESILTYSKKKNDWIHTVIKEHNGNDAPVKKWMRENVEKSGVLKKKVKKFGYGYFDVSERSFKTQVKTAVSYLLKH